jgi:uroporphyrinogen decarboxylase
MRGQQDFLMDVAEDPEWTRAFVDRVTDHILTVGVESIRRFTLQQTGIGIYDDICSIHGPVMGPRAFERIFLPSLRKMVKAYKKAGAAFVFLHCDGCVTDLLEMLVEAGIDAVHPLEARCNLHPRVVLERLGGRLRVIGGLDNCRILPRGDRRAVRRHAADLLKTGESGGYILAPHSIGEDISVETIEYLAGVLDRGTGRKQRA